MKFIKEILLFLVVIFVTKSFCNDDTVGSQFVTSFLYKNPSNSSKIHLSLYFLPKNPGNTTVLISYYSLLKKNLTTLNITATYNEHNQLTFDYADVISDGHIASGNVLNVTDPRIYIISLSPIKVLGRVLNLQNDQGDLYLVPPLSFAGTKYLFQLPPSVVFTNQLVHILAYPGKDANVQVIKTSSNGTVLLNQTVTITGTLGTNQKIIPITFNKESPSIYISSDSSIVVVAAVTCANLNAYSLGNTTSNMNCDYAAFMPQPIGTWDCSSSLVPDDKRVISGDHTVTIGVSPADTTCGQKFPVLSYTNLNSIIGIPNNLQTKQVSTFTVLHSLVNEYATDSKKASIALTRVGSPHANRNSTLDGIYMHHIPDVTQYYNGTTQFITFTNGDYIEVYVENLQSNDVMTLNGINLIKEMVVSQTIYSFGNTYSVYKLNANRLGVHTFSCTAKYVAYVISKISKNKAAYGYVAGFGTSQLTSTMVSGSTMKPIVMSSQSPTSVIISKTTQQIDLSTKSSSQVITSSLLLAFTLMTYFLFISK
ncbi:Hypothetical protein SRAE_1000081200 [Strongyloides ratti]|uniref:IgGFc-binding protein N-terminal domain-containing protein n=1 Tax=Strongyloides ratti TaxID=34506 RepID=A0A090L340_STRRB|nr:Hypothetical protein SRAE_1000081200 [Strongyloides ratti]CEF62542.1 Hypothetical protein SRAE_1000081200 [Strongyloides ratti]